MPLGKSDGEKKKILSYEELDSLISKLKSEKKVIVQCHGVFDLIHPGHIFHFQAAKKQGDILIVSLTSDAYVNKGPNRPVFDENIRSEALASIEAIDYVVVNHNPTAVEAIKNIKPDVYVKGEDYSNIDKDITGGIKEELVAVEGVGGRIHITREITYSSSELINNHFGMYSDEVKTFLNDFQNSYSSEEIIQNLKDLKDLKVLVVGETIIDEYCYCKPMGKASKEPIITTRFIEEEIFAGGVLAGANHIAGFCDQVDLLTGLGSIDSREDFIRQSLSPNITPKFIYEDDSRTIVKKRFVENAFLRKMFEIGFLKEGRSSQTFQNQIVEYLGDVLQNYDMTLVLDYGHGLIGEDAVKIICEKSNFLAVNTQTNSDNIGYNLITKYPRIDYLCVDEPEFRLATTDRFGEIEDLLIKTLEKLNIKKSSITRGHLGSISYGLSEQVFHTPVFSSKVIDTIGAGDAYISVTAPCVRAGFPMELVGFIGNAVGAMAVSIVGNRSVVKPVDLFKFLTVLLK